MPLQSSRLSGFHQLDVTTRQQRVFDACDISEEVSDLFVQHSAPMLGCADVMIENAIGSLNVPLGLATNLIVDDIDVLVPMATEESSVVAALCNGARQCRDSGGVKTTQVGQCMIGQIQLLDVSDPQACTTTLYRHKEEIRALCNSCDPVLCSVGGGFQDMQVRTLPVTPAMIVLHLHIDVRDAMGANAVNTMAETLAPYIEQWTGARVGLKILSNLADQRTVRATGVWPLNSIGGEAVRDAMLVAGQFATIDPYRAATHNKGVMNGISAVILATGNDTRAVEAGAHAYAARGGQYTALTQWEQTKEGDLAGSIELPMPVGIIGGATQVHPTAQLCLQLMNIDSAARLASVIAAVGLVQNFSAMKALATEGIQRGHMSLHARNIALAAGAKDNEADQVVAELISRQSINTKTAAEVLERIRGTSAL